MYISTFFFNISVELQLFEKFYNYFFFFFSRTDIIRHLSWYHYNTYVVEFWDTLYSFYVFSEKIKDSNADRFF